MAQHVQRQLVFSLEATHVLLHLLRTMLGSTKCPTDHCLHKALSWHFRCTAFINADDLSSPALRLLPDCFGGNDSCVA